MQIALGLGLLTAPLRPGAGAGPPAPDPVGSVAWPLDEPRNLTSGFGEYRPGHYHGGIDLSTERKVGRPLRAVDDGYVWRVRASGSGYGRAVYLRLADGRTAVTAHMEQFSPEIASFVESAQESLSRYEVDLYPPPGRLAVARGAVIGHSGESGAGPPHLHFELRSGASAEIGIHPLRNGFTVTDSVPPVVARLLVDELTTPEALLTRRGRRRRVPLRVSAPGRYQLADTLRVTGAAVLALETYDPGVGGSRSSPYRVRLSFAGAPEYELSFDAFDWSRAHEVELAFDPEEVAAGSNFVLRLFRPVGARDQRFQSAPEGAGVLGRAPASIPAGRSVRPFAIEVEDAAGNGASVAGVVLFAPVTDTGGVGDVPAAPTVPGVLDTLLVPGVACRFEIGAATVALDDSSLFAPGRWRLAPLEFSLVADDRKALAGPGLELRAPGVVIDRPITLALRPAPGQGSERLGLYRRVGGRWSWIGNETTAAGIGGSTRALGQFALLEDWTPPEVSIESPPAGGRPAAPRPELRARVSDDLAGLTWRSFEVRIDDLDQIVVFDPEVARLTGRSRRPLAPGLHRLTIRATDRAGNVRQVERTFRTGS